MVDMSKLRFTADAVVENRRVLHEERNRIVAELAAVDALLDANRKMCKHPRKSGYTDISGCYCCKCPDCGWST